MVERLVVSGGAERCRRTTRRRIRKEIEDVGMRRTWEIDGAFR